MLVKCVVLLSLFLVLAHTHTFHLPPPIHTFTTKAGAQITPSLSTLSQNGDWVSVAWSLPSPSHNITINVFAPSTANFAAVSPIKWMYIEGQSGSANFQLTNLRTDYAFVLVENGVAVATSTPVTFANPNEPLHLHLSLASDICSSCLRVMWVTRDVGTPQVKFGTSPGVYNNKISANTHTYTSDDLCGDPAKSYGYIAPGSIHEALVDNLTPNTVYYYVAGDDTFGYTEERTFSAPRVAAKGETVSFLAYGDLGKLEADSCDERTPEPGSLATSASLTNAVMNYSYDAILHIGDISYAVGFAAEWDSFFRLIEPFASRVPYMTCPGNHEFDFIGYNWLNSTDSGGECGVPYRNRFHMPLLGNPNNYYNNHSSNWYSFNMGPVHVLLMDTEESFDNMEEGQLHFIANDLASVDRSVTPFVIFAGHRPMYISSTNAANNPTSDQGMAILLRQYIDPLLHKYQVDLALWGHVHAYQRTCPVYNQTCTTTNDGTVHVVIGMAGAGFSNDVQFPEPDYIEYYDYINYGYANITVSPQLLHLQFITNDGVINDEVYIKSKFL